MAGSIYTVDQAASVLVAGVKQISNISTPVPLVAAPAPCKRVWVGGVGSGGDITIGSATCCNRLLSASNIGGFYIHVDDASKVYLQATFGTGSLNYWIEQ